MTDSNTSKQPSRHVKADEKLLLWVRAGGRCQLCNEYLLEDPSTREPINLGELAHNVGHKQNARSPRGQDPLAPELRNDADNLLLLCAGEHKSIDDKVNRGVYTVEYLRERKRRHEDRIRLVTGIGDDEDTVVIRVIGGVRGAPVELSQQTAAKAVLATGRRFPQFPFAYQGADFEIDLRQLPVEATQAYWEMGAKLIDERLGGPLRDAVARGDVRHLSLFGLTRMPLLAYAGFQIDDKVPVELFQKQRGDGEGWGWVDDAPPVSFAHERIRDGNPDRVVILVGLSAHLALEDVPKDLDDATVWEITPREEAPSRDVLRARASLDNFARAYHDCLGAIEAVRPKPSSIHLLPAVPVTAAMTLGRGVMRQAQPPVRIYDRSSPDEPFAFALEINS